MPLEPISSHCSYLPGANNLGLIHAAGSAIAIDTGIDKEAGRLLRRALEAAQLRLQAIVNTHHHADHVGGNDYLTRNLPELLVYAPRAEAPLLENPLSEPIYLHYGATPYRALRTKWLMHSGSPVHRLIDGPQLPIGDLRLEILQLPGHSLAQIGVAYDGVCFAADGFFGPAVLQRHGIPYGHDLAAQLASLDQLAASDYQWYLPGHGELLARAELPAVLQANRSAIERGSELVLAAIRAPADLGQIVQHVTAALGHNLAGLPQYAIFASTVAAQLSYLESQGRARVDLDLRGPLWSAC